MQKNKKRRAFNQIEDETIRKYVNDNGENWDEIAKKLPGRTPKQCHDRYSNYLRDGLKTEPWTQEEDAILMAIHNEIGPKWVKMMNYLPGRSGNDIKNRWHKHLVKKEKIIFNQQNINMQISPTEQNLFQNQSNIRSFIIEPIINEKPTNVNINPQNDCCKVKSIEVKKDFQYLPLPKINFDLIDVVDFTDRFLEEIFDDFYEKQVDNIHWNQYWNYI